MDQEKKEISFSDFVRVLIWTFKQSLNVSKPMTIALMIATVFSEVRGLANAYIVGLILDRAIEVATANGNLEEIYPYLALFLGYNILSIAIGRVRNYSENVTRNIGRLYFQRELYLQTSKLGVESLENPDIANNIQRATQNIHDIPWFLRNGVTFISRFISAVIAGITLYIFFPVLVPILIILAFPKMVTEYIYLRRIWEYDFETTEDYRKTYWHSSNLTSPESLKELKVTNAINFIDNKYLEFAKGYIKGKLKIYNAWYGFEFLVEIFNQFVVLGGYALAFNAAINGNITIGQLAFQLRNIDIFYGDFSNAVFNFFDLRQWAVKIKDVKDIFDLKPNHEDGKINLVPGTVPSIELKNVSFKYSHAEKYVLKDLNLKINAGEKVAIVGKNGAGKTTLVKLLSRFYRPTEGTILIDGTELNDITIESWYKQLSVLYQDFNKYGQLSVRENVTIGDSAKQSNDPEVWNALDYADSKEFVEEYESGLDQILSEKFQNGIRPSGGQWQKIAMARFFYTDSSVVIFDEPTAAIDAEAEYKIFNKIYEYFKNKTVIIISHRFSTVRNADRIVVLQDGKITEDGTHQELLEMQGKYEEMFKLQALGYE